MAMKVALGSAKTHPISICSEGRQPVVELSGPDNGHASPLETGMLARVGYFCHGRLGDAGAEHNLYLGCAIDSGIAWHGSEYLRYP